MNSDGKNPHPDRAECMRMLKDYGTPPHVIAHCKAVAAVAYRLAAALNDCGAALDTGLVLAAGLLHDIARVEEEHWNVAADLCEARGLFEEASIIRVHMNYDPFNDADHLNETDLVCLADRTVLEDRYTGIDRRMEYIVQKAVRNGHEEHVPFIMKKKEQTRELIRDIEKRIGTTLEDLFRDLDYENVENINES